ncbi:MAG: CHASE domain-containing protein [Cyanobacteria bacterium P01_F01_bin.150]
MPTDQSRFSIALSLIVGTSLSILATVAVARWERTNYRLHFQRQTDNLTTTLQRSINRYTDILLALGDFYSVSNNTVSRDRFNQFVERALDTYPGIQALEWAPLVLERDRPAFEAAIQAQGYPTFQITERDSRGALVRAQRRSHYVPVTYLQPWNGNELAFGYDLTSDPTRHQAMEKARGTGTVAASGPIRLVQEHKKQFGFLVFLPLYSSASFNESSLSSIEIRRQAVDGYLLGVFRVSDVVEEALQLLNYEIDFTLADQTTPSASHFLGHYDAATQTVLTDPFSAVPRNRILCPKIEDCRQRITTGGQTWAIAFSPAATYPAPPLWGTVSTLLVGLLLTLGVGRSLSQAQSEIAKTRELSELKTRLFSMASHELRTPLSTILISAQQLELEPIQTEEGTLSAASTSTSVDTKQQIYSRIRTAAKRMSLLLNDLLTLARAESGKLQFTPEIVNLPQFCQQLIDEIQFGIESAVSIEFRIEGDCQMGYVDPQLLRAVITNLLTNAIKYSAPDLNSSVPDPNVSLTLTGHAHEILFVVRDNGIGIPEQDQSRLNEAFYRGSNVGALPGTGLGLSVVSACLNLHQGKLLCQSVVGKGTEFTVKLPRVE